MEPIPPAASTGSPAATTSASSRRRDPRASRPGSCSSRGVAPLLPRRSAVRARRARAPRSPSSRRPRRGRRAHRRPRRGARRAQPPRRGNVGERRGSDHHPVGPRVECRGNRRDRAVAAAHLYREADRGRRRSSEATRRRAGERAVEIDDVQSCRASSAASPRELNRIAALQRDLLAPSPARVARHALRARPPQGSLRI